jgi:hypothetical protein
VQYYEERYKQQQIRYTTQRAEQLGLQILTESEAVA